MKKHIALTLLSALLALNSADVLAKTDPQTITFTKGSDHTSLQGSFTGYNDVQYKLSAKKGQILKFNLTSTQNLAYLNIYAPGNKPGKAEALTIDILDGGKGQISLPSTGQYTLQVYQMRNSARQNKTVKFNLKVQVLNATHAPKKFDATGQLPCSLALGQPPHQCQYGVVRAGQGNAELSIFSADKTEYQLQFKQGKLVAPSASTQKRAKLSLIELKTAERFEVLDSILYH